MTSSLANFNEAALTRTPVSRPPRPPRQPGKAAIALVDELFELGRQCARGKKVLVARQEDLEALSGQGRASARAMSDKDFDPSSIIPDRNRASLFEEDREESRRLGEEIRNASARSQDAAKDATADAALVGDEPAVPLIIMITTAAVIGMTIGPTVHDLILTTLRDDLNWALSLAVGLIIGIMLVWGLIADGESVSPRAALWGGVIIGGGFAILRMSAAEDFGEAAYAIGLTAIEVGALVFAHAVGTRYRADIARWQERRAKAAEAAARSESAQTVRERLLSERAAVEGAIRAHLAYADERRELSGDFASFETACVRAICAGYWRGLAENVGYTQGVPS